MASQFERAARFQIIRAKWDQIQAGDFFTWGLSPGRQRFKRFYAAAYLFMFCGSALPGM